MVVGGLDVAAVGVVWQEIRRGERGRGRVIQMAPGHLKGCAGRDVWLRSEFRLVGQQRRPRNRNRREQVPARSRVEGA